jgi:predicted molibdopterin-dependent oxidoreductase YjgC
LIDEGRMSEGTGELKAALQDPAVAEMHPDDAATIGVADAASVRLRTDAGEATLPLRVTETIAAGTVFVPFNQPGFAANTLLSGAFTAAVTVEVVEVVEVVEAEEPSPAEDPAPAAVGGGAA